MYLTPDAKSVTFGPMEHTVSDPVAFIFAGNATFTLVSVKTQVRYTYKLQKSDDGRVFFVRVLTGPENTTDFRYAGFFPADKRTSIVRGAKGMDPSAPSLKALAWYLAHVGSPHVEVWHQGTCGRCGRALTVPESIASGIGPVCEGRE